MKYPVGTKFKTRGKAPKICTVVDYYVTTNLKGEIVKQCYVATHEFLGQTIIDRDIPSSTIARGLIE